MVPFRGILVPSVLVWLAVAGRSVATTPDSLLHSESLPEPTHRETARYPDQAYRSNLGGLVVVRALVGLDGKVERAEVEKSDSMFDASAVRAARKFEFSRIQDDNGNFIRVWVRIPFRFRLGDPASDPRVLSDSLWRNPWKATPAVMRQQRESILRAMRRPDEVWLFRIDPNSEGDALPASARSRFERRAILEAVNVEDAATRSKIRSLLTDVRTHARPPRLKGEFAPRLGVRFVTSDEVIDVVVSFADAALFVKDRRHLWAGSAMPHWRAWGQLAHAAFPDDPNFARYATHDPREP